MYKIVWTEYAAKSYEETVNFLVENYSIDAAIKFDEKVNKLLETIEQFPYACQKHPTRKHLRKCKITHQTSLITFPKSNVVELVMFINNSMQEY